jgi:DNA invertase Pin-like site-specific DNA recombinase
VYAAKSTKDRRGSIPDQLRGCRAAIEAEPGRSVVAEYSDEAVSAFTRSRGPGLAEAMRHAEELAKDGGVTELWALHSDRLARGDGRAARHAVEIALWALKQDVAVKTVQDPDTFRDLLYAVVTGERNNEDSRRKGLASAAGRRRAVERGEYMGAKPDGYVLVVEVDDAGQGQAAAGRRPCATSADRADVRDGSAREGHGGDRTGGQRRRVADETADQTSAPESVGCAERAGCTAEPALCGPVGEQGGRCSAAPSGRPTSPSASTTS